MRTKRARTKRTAVQVRVEDLVIPTYLPALPDKNPMFLEKRVYQGSSGKVYPLPFTDRIAEKPVNRKWKAVWIENDVLSALVLPEHGGHIHRLLDKTNGYDLIYNQPVVKPALVGLAGPWISGGIEFNRPQHHRPATFLPVDFEIEKHADGSATIWCSGHDPMARMKGMHGVCLHPGRAVLELKVRAYAPNDLSFYANIPTPCSYMCLGSKEDFFGGYDYAAQAGIVHYANHHISPGKKQWTWGNHEFGYAWDRNLTDADVRGEFGPYIEIMAGVYTDNQPDFSFLQPGETRSWSQYWYPIQKIGPAQHANLDAAIALRVLDCGGKRSATPLSLGVSVTRQFSRARILLTAKGRNHFSLTRDLAPGSPFVKEIKLPRGVAEADLMLRVVDSAGDEIISYQPKLRAPGKVPPPATAPPAPADIISADELFVTALHLDQYRHATRCPTHYWREALRRDPLDARCNHALGLWHLKRGEFADAETHFRKAIERLTRRNANPYDGEPYYNLGLCLRYQLDGSSRGNEALNSRQFTGQSLLTSAATKNFEGAYAAFYKATWNQAWAAASYHALAEIDCTRHDWTVALDHLNRSLRFDTDNLRARNLKVMVWRKLTGVGQASRLPQAETRMFETAAAAVQRDDLGVELCALLNQTGRHVEAMELLARRKFQPWEGGEDGPMGQWVRSNLALGREALRSAGRARHSVRAGLGQSGNGAHGVTRPTAAAIRHFQRALTSPRNLGEAKHLLANQSEIHYWLGCACAAAGDANAARHHWSAAANFKGDFQQMSVRTFSEMTDYSARSLKKLGRRGKGIKLFHALLSYARKLQQTQAKIDYFATSLPAMLLFEDDLQFRQETTALFLKAQAYCGLGNIALGRKLVGRVLKRNPGHGGAMDLRRELEMEEL